MTWSALHAGAAVTASDCTTLNPPKIIVINPLEATRERRTIEAYAF